MNNVPIKEIERIIEECIEDKISGIEDVHAKTEKDFDNETVKIRLGRTMLAMKLEEPTKIKKTQGKVTRHKAKVGCYK